MKDNKDVAKGWIRKAESDIENLRTMMEQRDSLRYCLFSCPTSNGEISEGFSEFQWHRVPENP